MDTYSYLRQIADSWFLLAMFAFFIGAILFQWRPGSRKAQQDAADIVFRHEDRPAPEPMSIHPDPIHPSKEVRS